MNLTEPLAVTMSNPLPVPAAYAEKAMASIMQLHGELMDEKERRVELFRRLMEKEQALAELRMYVKILEEQAARAAPAEVGAVTPAPVDPTSERPTPSRAEQPPPRPPRVAPRFPRPPEGWKVW